MDFDKIRDINLESYTAKLRLCPLNSPFIRRIEHSPKDSRLSFGNALLRQVARRCSPLIGIEHITVPHTPACDIQLFIYSYHAPSSDMSGNDHFNLSVTSTSLHSRLPPIKLSRKQRYLTVAAFADYGYSSTTIFIQLEFSKKFSSNPNSRQRLMVVFRPKVYRQF